MQSKLGKLNRQGERLLYEGKSATYIFLFFLLTLFSRGFPDVALGYNLVPVFLLVYFIFGIITLKESIDLRKIVLFIILFSSWALISSLWSEFPLFTLKRSFYFLLVALGSIVVGYKLNQENKCTILDSFLVLNIILILVSFFSLLSNIP